MPRLCLRKAREQQRQQWRLEDLAWVVGGCFGLSPVEAALHPLPWLLIPRPLLQNVTATRGVCPLLTPAVCLPSWLLSRLLKPSKQGLNPLQ